MVFSRAGASMMGTTKALQPKAGQSGVWGVITSASAAAQMVCR
jgi:hypothetical protein